MGYIRLKSSNFRIGKALESDIYNSHGELLLRKNYIIESNSQLNSLLELGMYRASGDASDQGHEPLSPIPESPFSVMKEIAYLLPKIFTALLEAHPDSVMKIMRIAADIQRLCKVDSDAMIGAIHLCRDCAYTVHHPLHQAILCEVIGVGMDIPMDERRSILSAALTANIATIDLQETLHTQESPLTTVQKDMIDSHPQKGYQILQAAGVKDKIWLEAVLQHHEQCNGDGYPQGLSAGKISRAAAFISVTDRYTAMVSARTYRKPMTAKEALQEFFMQRNGGLHEELAIRCIKEMGIYPPGSFVRLESGEIAMVTKRNKSEGVWPTVSSFVNPRGSLYLNPLKRDCDKDEATIKESCIYEEYDKLNLDSFWGYC